MHNINLNFLIIYLENVSIISHENDLIFFSDYII